MTEATNEAPAAPEPSTLLTDPPTAEGQAAAGQGEQGAEPAAKPALGKFIFALVFALVSVQAGEMLPNIVCYWQSFTASPGREAIKV